MTTSSSRPAAPSVRSTWRSRRPRSTICAAASPRPAGRPGNWSPTARRACSWRRCRRSCRYWATEYDWRRCEARLNALPQFMTEIDGVDIHFIHVRSPHPDALPLIMTHGWPGSVVELLETVGPLTDPTAHGGRAEDAFDLVLPSLPGYGFSGEPTELGWDLGRTARAWAELMRRLGYTRYVAQGGDVGRRRHRRDGPPGTRGAARHPHQPARDGAGRRPQPDGHRAGARGGRRDRRRSGRPATATSSSRPPGRRRSATPCWTPPSPWPPGCSTTTPTPTTRSPARSSTGSPSGNLTRDHVLDNVTLYWLTGTGASAARSYWEAYGADAPAAAAAGQAPPEVTVPAAFTTFPGEIWRTPRSWAEKAYPDPRATSTRSTGAATSPPGRSRSCSRPRSGRRSAPSAGP